MCNLQCAGYCSQLRRLSRWWWRCAAVSQVSLPSIHLSPKLHLPRIAPSNAGAGVEVEGDGDEGGGDGEEMRDDKEMVGQGLPTRMVAKVFTELTMLSHTRWTRKMTTVMTKSDIEEQEKNIQ